IARTLRRIFNLTEPIGRRAHHPAKPGAPAVVAHRSLRNAIQPGARMGSVESIELASHYHEHLLSDVFHVSVQSPERTRPAANFVKPTAVNIIKGKLNLTFTL